MNKSIYLFCLLFFVIAFSCKKDDNSDNQPFPADTILHETPDDYVWDEASEYAIELNGSTANTDAPGVTINGNIIVINSEGNYVLKGEFQGSLMVTADTSAIIRLILNGVDIENPTGPAILIESAKKTIICLNKNTSNSLSDAAFYTGYEADVNATLYSRSDLTVFGEGSLSITGNYKDGLTGKDGLIVKSGSITVETQDDGIRGKDYAVIMDGKINIEAGANGIVADNDASIFTGYILILGGEISVDSQGDGISANSTVTSKSGTIDIISGGGNTVIPSPDRSTKGIKGLLKVELAFSDCNINSSDDAIHSNGIIQINSGNYKISTGDDAVHADSEIVFNEGEIEVLKSVEGFESKTITIYGGQLSIISSDDCINATAGSSTEQDDGSYVYINGGVTVLNTSGGDGLDSNGSIRIKNGTLIIHGPEDEPEVGIDYNGVFDIEAGLLIASGTGTEMTQALSVSSTQPSIRILFQSKLDNATIIHIQDLEGKNILTFKPQHRYQSVIFSSALLKIGSSYKIYSGGSSTGNDNYGHITEGIYTPGTMLKDFTITQVVTLLSI